MSQKKENIFYSSNYQDAEKEETVPKSWKSLENIDFNYNSWPGKKILGREEEEEIELPINIEKIRKNTKSSIDDTNEDLKINTKRIMVIGAAQTGKKSLVFSLFGEGSEESAENMCK